LAQCFTHTPLAFAFVVVPGVVQKIDPAIHARVNQLDGIGLAQLGLAQVIASHADAGDLFASVT
jgi:hypothetical protein